VQLTNREFQRSHPALVFEWDAIFVDIPDDQPPYIGVRARCAGQRDPREHLDVTLRVPLELAEQVHIQLGALLAMKR